MKPVCLSVVVSVPLSPSSRGRGLKLTQTHTRYVFDVSPSSRGRGLKHSLYFHFIPLVKVALFTRAWIETAKTSRDTPDKAVALFTRAWIETQNYHIVYTQVRVALFTRAWIETAMEHNLISGLIVALFTRAWIETFNEILDSDYHQSRPLHEGVD